MSEVAAAVEEPAEQTSDSLINISTEPEVVKEETPAHLVDENEGTVDEPVEEQNAERPEWLEERFWNEEKGETDVEKLGRSYKDLRKKMAEGSHKVPKEYDMGALESLDQEDPALSEFLDLAKSEQLSQGQFDTLTKWYVELQQAQSEQIETDRAVEMNKLGRNADSTIKSVEAWVTKFASSGVLSDSEVEAVGEASKSAAFVSALNKIRRAYNEPTIPSSQEIQTDAEPTTLADIQSMMSDERYGSDPAFTNRVEKMVYAMHGEQVPS